MLRSLNPLWAILRGPYLGMMRNLGSAQGIAIHVGGTEMRLHPDFVTQNWETVEYASYRAYAEMLRPGDVVFDIGAHIGTYTLIALDRIGPAGRVVAYEPHEFTRNYLEQHLAWNGGGERVLVRDVCCGQQAGKAIFYFAPGRAEGMNGLVAVDGFAERIADVTTVDREVIELGLTPSVIKIDVEGAEWDVLKGAEQTLRRASPRLSLSLHPAALSRKHASESDVLGWLSGLGYEWRVIARDHETHIVATNPRASP